MATTSRYRGEGTHAHTRDREVGGGMNGRIVYTPRPARHRCYPPAREVYATGTVWQCFACEACWELMPPSRFEQVGRWEQESSTSAVRRQASVAA